MLILINDIAETLTSKQVRPDFYASKIEKNLKVRQAVLTADSVN